ncbi:MAG: Ca-activated chloride channel family protein [Cryomorphaceae bacterium]|jgi:Ca-activated chloride channel family protein
MVILYVIPISVLLVSALAEWLHLGRVQKIARLAFGPSQKPTLFGALSPIIRVLMLTLLAWGLTALLMIDPKIHTTEIKEVEPEKMQHLILVLDVSPSMYLEDAGPDGKDTRLERASTIVKSIFSRLSQDYLHLSIVATYNGAIPVVIDTRDLELINSMLDGLPMFYAFKPGKTKLFDGIQAAADMAKKWNNNSTTILMISDGETIPASGMPVLPPSISDTLIVGVGDAAEGKFINGEHSRQDVPALKQIANRLGGTYHDANRKHVPSETLRRLSSLSIDQDKSILTIRELALIAITISTSILALLSLLLYHLGSRWKISSQQKSTSNPVTS